MAELIKLPNFVDLRGELTVMERLLPFDIKRVFFIRNGKGMRGGKKHLKAHQAIVSISGSCKVKVGMDVFELNNPVSCLILKPEDPHNLSDFSEDNIILVLSTEYYDTDEFMSEKEGENT